MHGHRRQQRHCDAAWRRIFGLSALGLILAPAGAADLVRQLNDVGPVGSFLLTPDGRRAVYTTLADEELIGGSAALYSRPLDGSLPSVRLDEPGAADSAIWSYDLQLSPDSRRVLFHRITPRRDEPGGNITGFAYDVYSRLLDGSAPAVKLHTWSHPDYDEPPYHFAFSPDSQHLLYTTGPAPYDAGDLFIRPLDGSGGPRQVNEPPAGAVDPSWQGLTLGGAPARAVFRVAGTTWGQWNLYSAPLDGSTAPVPLNGPLGATGHTAGYCITPGGGRVVFVAAQAGAATPSLYVRPIDGSGTPLSLATLAPTQSLLQLDVTPDETRVVYAFYDVADTVLATVGIDGGAPLRLNDAPEPGGATHLSFAITADSSRVVYCDDHELANHGQLYTRPIDGSAPAQKLSGLLGPDEDIYPNLQFSADGRRVLFYGVGGGSYGWQVFTAPTDGSGPTVKVPYPADGGMVHYWRLSPDGRWVVLGWDANADDEIDRLYAVPAAGGPLQPLTDPLPTSGGIPYFAFLPTPDSGSVIYQAGSNLFVVPLPEPGTLLVITVAGVGLLGRRRD